MEVFSFNVSDDDSGKNSEITYDLVQSNPGFQVDKKLGKLLANLTLISSLKSNILHQAFDLLVAADDSGVPSRRSIVPVRVLVLNGHQQRDMFLQTQYRGNIKENAAVGTKVLSLISNNVEGRRSLWQSTNIEIINGNDNNAFEILLPNFDLILARSLDRETKNTYHLQLLISEKELSASNLDQNSTIDVIINVDDINDNYPRFTSKYYQTTLNESVPLKYVVGQVEAVDLDAINTENAEVIYNIISGNDDQMFSIDLLSGTILVNNRLDYDTYPTEYSLIIQACDSGFPSKCSLQSFNVNLTDSNDNLPLFPLSEYYAMIPENEPLGTEIVTIKATDFDAGKYGYLTYSLTPLNEFTDVDESWSAFTVDAKTGTIFSKQVFDYEVKSRYSFLLVATDFGGQSVSTRVHILVESRDEFVPQFTEKAYHFTLKPHKGKSFIPQDHFVGYVRATDKDLGSDGHIVYQLTTNNPYFKLNYTNGAIITKHKLDYITNSKDVSLVVTASSGRQGSLSNMTVVEILIDSTAIGSLGDLVKEEASEGGGWVFGLLITILLFLTAFATAFFFLHWRKRGLKHVSKPRLNSENNTINTNSYVDPSTFDTIPIRGSDVAQSSSSGFAPPRYDEIPPYGLHNGSSNSGAATTSDLSTSDQSGSSGRGSAEDDGEDEEIRMINEGPLQREVGLQSNSSRLSDVSVHNSHHSNQEYFGRLGIAQSNRSTTSSTRRGPIMHLSDHHHPIPIKELQMYEEENDEVDLNTLIYAKLNDNSSQNRDDLGMHNNEEDITSNYNWDYLLDWGPQYQPLAHVFSEIARLKDDTMSVRSGQSMASSIRSKNSLHHTMKHLPPPLITNVAPRLVPVMSSRGSSKHHYPPVTNRPVFQGGFSTPSPMPPSFTNNLIPTLSTHNYDSHSHGDAASIQSMRKS